MTTIILGALLVGLILGLLGSGGSTVMVPILVYLVGHDAKVSIAESMAIVGAISLVGAWPFTRAKQVHWRSVILFGIPAMLGTLIGAYLGGLASDAMQLVVFGLVVLAAAILMIKKSFGKKGLAAEQIEVEAPLKNPTPIGNLMIFVEGLLVGSLTGFVGVGGGFLIVPALLIFAKLPMRMAIGTSLVIIVFKCIVGFAKYQSYLVHHDLSVDWQTVGIFSIVGVAGCLVGQQLNAKLNQQALMQVFAVFLVLIGSFVIIREGSDFLPSDNKTNKTEQTTSAKTSPFSGGVVADNDGCLFKTTATIGPDDHNRRVSWATAVPSPSRSRNSQRRIQITTSFRLPAGFNMAFSLVRCVPLSFFATGVFTGTKSGNSRVARALQGAECKPSK